MKKYILSILLFSCFFLASAGERNTCVGTISVEYKISSLNVPCPELEIAIQSVATSPGNQVVNKITAGNELPQTLLLGYVAALGSFSKYEGSAHAKDYLIHIYPSHHFW